MRAGVGLGAAVSLETPGLRVNAVDAETLAEEQGINPAVAGAINEALDQIDATEIDNQIENPSNVPSQAQRQEALSVIAQNLVGPFRESLATEAEKLAFDSLVSGKSATAQDAAKIGTTIDNINALKSAIKLKFVSSLEAQYRANQAAGTLPSREVAEPEGVVKAGNLTYQQIKPFEDLFKKYQADSMFDDTELENAKALLDQVRGTRSAQMLRAFESYISNVASDKISPDAITELPTARQTSKLFATKLDTEVSYYEYGSIDLPALTAHSVGDFKVRYGTWGCSYEKFATLLLDDSDIEDIIYNREK
jgi:hypothetical protein